MDVVHQNVHVVNFNTNLNLSQKNDMYASLDLNVLDLFCGTGSLGIEAISMSASKCYFVDKITGETVLEVKSSGRPFTKTIDCSQFTNPVDMYIDAYISTSSYGDPWATCTLGNVYLKVRDDYQG